MTTLRVRSAAGLLNHGTGSLYALPMTDPNFILMVQPMSHQGAIWQTILRSQNLSVIWESPDVDLLGSLSRLKRADVALPDLLLIDTRTQKFNPYSTCRWSRRHCPELKILLVNGAQKVITASEREWAMLQGAVDLLPRLQRDRLMSGAVERVKRVLELLDYPAFDSKALVHALLKVSRSNEILTNGIDKVGYREPDDGGFGEVAGRSFLN